MALLTVRLSPADERAVKALRADGVPIADLVRDTIQKEYASRKRRRLGPDDVRKLIAEIDAAHPIPAGTPERKFSTLDRKAVRQFIVKKLKSKGRK